MAADIKSLCDQLGPSAKTIFVGHDIGAMIALAYGFKYPADATALVLIDAPLQGSSFMSDARGDPRAWHVGFHQARDIAEYLVQGRERTYLRYMIDVRIFDPAAISQDDFDVYLEAYEKPGALRAAFELYRAFDDDSRAIQLSLKAAGKLATPVMTIAGEHSGLTAAMSGMANELASRVENRIAPAASHWVPEENPDFVAGAICDLLAGL
jgi:pimeloyl-ACP methyl ester carboxylesterase